MKSKMAAMCSFETFPGKFVFENVANKAKK